MRIDGGKIVINFSRMNETKQDPKQMTEQEQPGIANQKKDPESWVTGDEPMTGAQASYLKTLTEQTGEAFDGSLSKAAASQRIDALRKATGVAEKTASR